MTKPVSLLSALILVGCSPESNLSRKTYTDVFQQEPAAIVDVLWVVDNSISMVQEQEEVAAGFTNFISMLDSVETGIDFHIGIVTTDMDDDNPDRGRMVTDDQLSDPYITRDTPDFVSVFQKRVQVGIQGSDREQGLEAAWVALTEPMISTANAGFLRDDAVLSIIFLSDENDCSDRGALPAGATGADCYTMTDLLVPVKTYVNDFHSLKDDNSLIIGSAIVGPEASKGCEDSWHGTRYLAFAAATGGLQGNICEQDYTGMMEDLGLHSSGIRTSFQLTYAPVVETMEVWVDENQVFQDPTNGWTFDAENLFLTFNGNSVPPRGSTITVSYEMASG